MKTFKIVMMALMMCYTSVSFGQDTLFKISQDGLTDYVITICDDKTQSDLYKKTLEWISVTYKTPSSVIKAQIENNYIRIEGSAGYLVHFGPLGGTSHLTRYQIEISFKDGKYKFDVISIEIYVSPGQYNRGGWFNLNFSTLFDGSDQNFRGKSYLNDDGEIRPYYKECYRIPVYFNDLNFSLKDFIMSESIPSKSNDW